MAVERVDMWRVVCDRCGKRDETDEYYAWADQEQAVYSVEASDWLVNDDGHWCLACITWDEEKDEMVPTASTEGTNG